MGFEVAATARRSADGVRSVSRTRTIASMALAGCLAGAMASFIAPICLIVGVFPKFVITAGAFGAVLGLGVNQALKTDDQRIIHISAGGFAAGGLLAWLFHSPNADFTAMHLAIIALAGMAALSYAAGLPRGRAIVVTAVAAILFPITMSMITRVPIPSVSGSVLYVAAMMPLLSLIPLLPFAIFGAIVGALMNWD
ncbi:MAG TPA: hypothetical protein VLV78_16685 [Thermoanaerobaculia bacterium]|nr:hypothetical protein [Thermoanaerobaculia bacterium]